MHDEIRAGNLAIEGAKNFGRFEAFFLPSVEWEQIREAFWARTGLPSNPDSAVDQLKARLSDAIDRFLESIPDNRQVAFDDNGWRLKTDTTEMALLQSLTGLVNCPSEREQRWRCARYRSSVRCWRAKRPSPSRHRRRFTTDQQVSVSHPRGQPGCTAPGSAETVSMRPGAGFCTSPA